MSSSNSTSSSLSSYSFSSEYGRHYDDDGESCKKLSLFSLPARFPPPETPPPPLETSASVPFRWEEAPGRPRVSSDTGRAADKSLELPPRLLSERHVHNRHHGRIKDMPSPTTVLDGPADSVGRSLAYGVSFRSFRSPESLAKRDRAGHFGSSRWGGSFRKSGVVGHNNKDFAGGGVEGSSDFSSSILDGAGAGEDVCKVKVTKTKKGTKSHLWESIYESLKQVVPWKRRERARK